MTSLVTAEKYEHFIFVANLALTFGILVHIIGYLVIFGLVTDDVYPDLAGSAKVILAIIYPNFGLCWGLKVLQVKIEKFRLVTFVLLHAKCFC